MPDISEVFLATWAFQHHCLKSSRDSKRLTHLGKQHFERDNGTIINIKCCTAFWSGLQENRKNRINKNIFKGHGDELAKSAMHFRREHILTLTKCFQNVIPFQEFLSCLQSAKCCFAVKRFILDTAAAGCIYFLWRLKSTCQTRFKST